MPKPPLTVVPTGDAELYNLGTGPETTAQRVQRLQHEAHLLAREQVEALEVQLKAVAAMAAEIAQGGEAYPAGVREMAERLAADLPNRAQSLQAVLERVWK
jgi:hypothetical protein